MVKGASLKAERSRSARAFLGGGARVRIRAKLRLSMPRAMKAMMRVAQGKPRVGWSLRKTMG